MPPPIPVILADYDPTWPERAAEFAAGLHVLGPVLATVHHIGSTSVPGLAAKPIIDLMPLVTDLAALDPLQCSVEALGYRWHGEFGIQGRRYCALTDDAGTRIAQLHFFEQASPHVERHLAFRDYLRAHPQIAKAYENEKRRAQQLHPCSSHDYSLEKSAWIENALCKALVWNAEQRAR
jgi:GrpB-like predicted nucleotidyltransferase (UPF0157 family)